MTLFQHTLGQLLRGEKTETSRLALPLADGEHIVGREMIQYPSGVKSVMRGTAKGWTVKWQVGKDYAIQPARGVASIGRYRLIDVWRQDVRTLTTEQIKAEGWEIKEFDSVTQYPDLWFLRLWVSMHDKLARVKLGQKPRIEWHDYLAQRPAEYYMTWRMSITVLWDTVDWDAPAVKALHIDHHQELIKALNMPVR